MNLDQAIKQTYEDFNLSRSEKKALAELFEEHPLSTKNRMVLKSKLFKMVKETLHTPNAEKSLSWLESMLKLLDKTEEQAPNISSFFSPGEECRTAILNEIKHAKRSLDICVFTITDNQISKEIENTFKRIPVRIISDNDKSGDLGSDIYRFHQNGLKVKIDETDKHMHHKFMIIDNKRVLTGSYNWTVSAAEKNEENIIILNDIQTVNRFSDEFNKLWNVFSPIS